MPVFRNTFSQFSAWAEGAGPKLVAALVILVVGWLVAKLAKVGIPIVYVDFREKPFEHTSKSMEIIGEEGAGVIVVINKPRTNAFTAAIQTKAGQRPASEMEELRDYGVGAMILNELGVEEMELLTNSHHTLVGLDGYGLSVVGERPIDLEK